MQNSSSPKIDVFPPDTEPAASDSALMLWSMPLAVLALDSDFRIQHFSQSWLALMSTVLERKLVAAELLQTDYRQELDLFLPLVHELERVAKGEPAEPWIVQIHKYECQEHWVNVTCSAWYSADGTLGGSIASFYDVTSLSKPEQLLRMANEELIQFNYHVSHDLVAPISSARGLINLIQSDVEAGELEEVPEMLSEAQEQLVRLDQLVVDLMNLARADARTNEITVFALPALVDEIAASLALNARDITISFTLKFDLRDIMADRVRVQQILTNLLSNAKKFVDPDEPAPDITVSSYADNKETVIQVSDNGLGIDDKLAKKLFGIFSRGSSGHSGHGLGLYIVLKHAKHLGGSVKVISYAKPTIFEVRFPALRIGQ